MSHRPIYTLILHAHVRAQNFDDHGGAGVTANPRTPESASHALRGFNLGGMLHCSVECFIPRRTFSYGRLTVTPGVFFAHGASVPPAPKSAVKTSLKKVVELQYAKGCPLLKTFPDILF